MVSISSTQIPCPLCSGAGGREGHHDGEHGAGAGAGGALGRPPGQVQPPRRLRSTVPPVHPAAPPTVINPAFVMNICEESASSIPFQV